MLTKIRGLATLFVLAGGSLVQAQPADPPRDIGRQDFETYCALCHGKDGKGGGPFSMLITKKTPDLTTLAKNNGGVFPFARSYEIIIGNQDVEGHGPREMPIWGDRFREKAAAELGPYSPDTTSYVRGRIIALIGHISTLQEK